MTPRIDTRTPMMRLAIAAVAACLLAACAATQKEPPPKPFIGTKWQVVLELPIPGEQPTFRFGDGRVEGFSGCNQVTAKIMQDSVGSRFIAIGRLEVGKRLCDGPARNAESHVLGVLQNVSSYTITADTMVMSGSTGSLKFQAVP